MDGTLAQSRPLRGNVRGARPRPKSHPQNLSSRPSASKPISSRGKGRFRPCDPQKSFRIAPFWAGPSGARSAFTSFATWRGRSTCSTFGGSVVSADEIRFLDSPPAGLLAPRPPQGWAHDVRLGDARRPSFCLRAINRPGHARVPPLTVIRIVQCRPGPSSQSVLARLAGKPRLFGDRLAGLIAARHGGLLPVHRVQPRAWRARRDRRLHGPDRLPASWRSNALGGNGGAGGSIGRWRSRVAVLTAANLQPKGGPLTVMCPPVLVSLAAVGPPTAIEGSFRIASWVAARDLLARSWPPLVGARNYALLGAFVPLRHELHRSTSTLATARNNPKGPDLPDPTCPDDWDLDRGIPPGLKNFQGRARALSCVSGTRHFAIIAEGSGRVSSGGAHGSS